MLRSLGCFHWLRAVRRRYAPLIRLENLELRKSSTIANRHGVMNSTWMVDVTMPPMLGAAMGFRMSIPGRVEKAIGSKDRMTAATVINFGRRRVVDPRMTASV